MFKQRLCIAGISAALLLLGTSVSAHTLWINVVPEYNSHVIASLAYGDLMPGSELLTPDWGPMTLDTYELISPAGKRSSLGVPKLVTAKKEELESGLQMQPGGDTGQRKFIVGALTEKGTYHIVAKTPVARLVDYVDAEGKDGTIDSNIQKLPKDAEIVGKSLEVNLMSAVFSVGAWSEPAPAGLALEIVPLSDLYEARVGDRARFKVLLNGDPWSSSGHQTSITAHNTGFGDRWGLYSELKFGTGEFRIQEAGLWRVDVVFRGTAGDVEAYKDEDPDLPLLIESSFVFYVTP